MSIRPEIEQKMEEAEARAQAKEATGKRINRPSVIKNREEIRKELKAKPQQNDGAAGVGPSSSSGGPTTFTFEQVQQMMAQMRQDTLEQMKEFARELKAPSEEETRKLEEARKRQEALMAAMIEAAKQEEQMTASRQASCRHCKPDGSMNYGGQVHGDKVILICKRCMKELVRRQATPDDMQNGPMELLVENARLGMTA